MCPHIVLHDALTVVVHNAKLYLRTRIALCRCTFKLGHGHTIVIAIFRRHPVFKNLLFDSGN
jgi:hypothetical protein